MNQATHAEVQDATDAPKQTTFNQGLWSER